MFDLARGFSRAIDRFRERRLSSKVHELGASTARATARRLRPLEYRVRYGYAAPRPYDLLWVDPAEIRYFTNPASHYFFPWLDLSGTYVEGGSWDVTFATRDTLRAHSLCSDEVLIERGHFAEIALVELDDWIFYRSMISHFVEGVPWAETKWYRHIASGAGTGVGKYGDVATMERRLAETDALYESVKTGGYKTQRELRESDDAPFSATSRSPPEYHEVVISISCDGELLFEEGRHRLSVAKALGLDRIPVRVLVRHEQWQQRRSRVVAAVDPSKLDEVTASYLDHPDMLALCS